MDGITERLRRLSDALYERSPFIPFLLLGSSVVLFVAVVLIVTPDGSEGEATGGFFSDPAPAILMLLAGIAVISSGATALLDLLGHRLSTGLGRWAFRLALVNCLLIPVAALLVTAIAGLTGAELDEGWGQPIMPIWFIVGAAATVLGAIAPEHRRRGILVLPLMIGTFALVFLIGEFTVPH
jgi:hypothetical protein